MLAPLVSLLLAGVVVADSSSITEVDINQFSALYNGQYSAAMVSYASYLAAQGFNASYITSIVAVAYGYGSNTLDQSSYNNFLSDNLAEASSIASVRATESFSFSKESFSTTSSGIAPKTSGSSGSAASGSAGEKTTSAKSSAASGSGSGSGSGAASGSGSGSGSGSASATGSSSSKANAALFVAPVGAAIGAAAVALL